MESQPRRDLRANLCAVVGQRTFQLDPADSLQIGRNLYQTFSEQHDALVQPAERAEEVSTLEQDVQPRTPLGGEVQWADAKLGLTQGVSPQTLSYFCYASEKIVCKVRRCDCTVTPIRSSTQLSTAFQGVASRAASISSSVHGDTSAPSTSIKPVTPLSDC
jgi:hypothetical protein